MSDATLLPANVPLFPLGGVILLPGEILPLNVFEPRYLNMVDDARRDGGHIGIVQTQAGASGPVPALAAIGSVGRLDSFRETEDGRYLITLTGISRFALGRELDVAAPYRVARADYAPYETDLLPVPPLDEGRERLTHLLQAWFHIEGVGANWESFAAAPLGSLVDRLAMVAPFEGAERQRLLEAMDIRQRLQVMEEIIATRLADQADGAPQ